MGRPEEIAKAGGELEVDRRIGNLEICLARRIGPKMAADLVLDISTSQALTALEAVVRTHPAATRQEAPPVQTRTLSDWAKMDPISKLATAHAKK